MKKIIFILALCCSVLLGAEEFVTVYKDGDTFFVRSAFSAAEDLVIQIWRYANERAYLIPKGSPIEKCTRGKVLHSGADDYPATTPLGAYSILSGNHGSNYTRLLTIPGHGLTDKDKGGVVEEKGRRPRIYIILKILDKNSILIHPEGRAGTVKPGFAYHRGGKLFYKGRELAVKKSVLTQLYPLNRITDYRLLADGKTPVPEKKEIKCRFAELIFVHDVINPYHVVQMIKKTPHAPGYPEWKNQHFMQFVNTPELKKKYAPYMKLPSLATYSNKISFQPRGAVVNRRKAHYTAALSAVSELDVMFMWTGLMAQQKRTLFYVPKMKVLNLKTRREKKPVSIDLASGYLLPRKLDVSYYIPVRDAVSLKDLPDRYIRISGDEKQYLYGIALGYSLFEGCTAKKNMPGDRDSIYHLYRTHKMYPKSRTLRNVKANSTYETVAYHQYFNPQKEPDATSFYCHYQGKSLMVYLDFHKVLKNKSIKLPADAKGKKITVIEKTPALTLHTVKRIPASCTITLSNKTKHGYLVLKLD